MAVDVYTNEFRIMMWRTVGRIEHEAFCQVVTTLPETQQYKTFTCG